MAQVIAPEVWQEGIEDNRLLPGRYTTGMFTGSGVKIANNGEACRVWDIQISDYITDYDDRRINGFKGTNTDGHDGWGASAYGVFQDVRFDSRVYTMGRHRSIAMRVFDEMQYGGAAGTWGSATQSSVISNGQALMKTAQIISKAKDIWEKQVLGPDIDKYNLFAVCNGHISGRAVGKVTEDGVDYNDQVFDGDASHYNWIAQPGMVEGAAIPPRFAPIHCIKWDDNNIPLFLQNIKVTWNNLFIEQNNRVIYMDPFYEFPLLRALTGNGVPATEAAYSDIQNGSFTRLMGWEFNFEIPTQYWPKLYVDANLNVVHSATKDGIESDTLYINSIDGGTDDAKLLRELVAADRVTRSNFVRTVWDSTNGKFKKIVTNYPLGLPGFDGYYDVKKEQVATWDDVTGEWETSDYSSDAVYAQPTKYPFTAPGAGYGLAKVSGPQGTISLSKVIGLALYRPSAQLSQEYSEMVTDEGRTRGKFTEMVMDIKYDAWVIERLSAGILPILGDAIPTTGDALTGIPVYQVNGATTTAAVGE